MNISCATITGYDVQKMLIEENLIILTESNSNMVTFSFTPDRQDKSKEFVCKSKPNWLYVRVNVLVNYSPDVELLIGVNRIDCFPDGFPDTYTFYRWEHQSELGEHIRFINGLGNGTLILQTLPQRYQISGIYVCTVSNGIPDTNGSKFQKGFTSFNYEGPPLFVPENRNVKFVELYQPITVTFLIFSNPIVDEIWIEAVAARYTINETIHDFRISEIELSYSEFKNRGNIKGNQIAFDFKMFSNEYEMYKIWTKNGQGEDSFSFNIQAVGAPIFVPENRNVKHGKLGEHLTLTFLLYSDPLVDDIWIKSVGTDRNQSGTKHEFRISNTNLSYTASGNKGNISGYEITIETNILNSKDFCVYKIWAENKLGVASYRFEIIAVESQKWNEINNNDNFKEITRFITISTIATCLLVYIVVNHICICVRQRTKRTRRSNVPVSLLEDMYDEIGTISYQAANISQLATEQPERIQQFRRIRSPQPESRTANLNNQLSMDRTFNTSSRLSVQEYQVNALHPNNMFGATSNVSPVLATEDIVHINGSYDIDPSGESSQEFQSGRHQYEHSSNSNRTTTISSSSDESRIESSGTTLVGLDIDEGYENPYQIVIREEQDSHKYSYLTKQSETIDNDSSLSDTAELSRNNRDYVNLRL
ncbi:uncharacterized protein LOC127723082 [Mytilus californianus]|uniref:uncharacterized protein LOC127723082 n=1 Tax=Mytilus californianus TaxID=6549 RepID=UPI00224786B2|nr:uncharacterized protein LOC127723082 [Mytilus californianus]